MYGLLASLALAFAPAPAPADDAAAKELAALGQKVRDAESYSFTFMLARQEEEKDASPWKVEFKKKLPYHYQRGDVEFFKSDDKYVLKGKDGKWTLADAAARAGQPTPKAGGTTAPKSGDGGTPEPGKSGEGRGPKVGLERIFAATEVIPLPHRLFNDFATKVAEVTKEEKDGKVVFHAKLTPAAAREMLNARAGRTGHGGGKGEGKGGGKGGGKPPAGGEEGGDGAGGGAAGGDAKAPKHEVEASGTMNVTAKGEVIETIDFDLSVKLPSGDRKGGGTLTLSNLNATNLVVPAEVQAALGNGAAPEKK